MKPDQFKVLCSSILIFMGAFSHAQDQPDLIPPSPAATAFQRVGVEQTSPYTGGADVSITLLVLHEISKKSFSNIIELNY